MVDGWVHLTIDVNLNTPDWDVTCSKVDLGDSGRVTTTATKTTTSVSAYDNATIGAVLRGGTSSGGFSGMIHSLRLTDFASDKLTIEASSKI